MPAELVVKAPRDQQALFRTRPADHRAARGGGSFRETRRQSEAFIAKAKGRRASLGEPAPLHRLDESAHLAHPALLQDRHGSPEQEPSPARLVGGGAEP